MLYTRSPMRIQNAVAITAALGLSMAFSASAKKMSVKVQMNDAQGKSVGTAVLSPAPKGVKIQLSLMNLPAGEHAIHVHGVAKCEGPAFTTAGGHFNPDSKHHGMQNPDGPHAGDMPNFTVGANGKSKMTIIAPGVTMGDDKYSIFTNGGTALMIHEKADDMKTDPAGAAGTRIACGVIAKP